MLISKIKKTRPEIAIVFWFYKEPKICLNHLKLIKKYNPDVKVFGLFGGEEKDKNIYKKLLSKYLNNFYLSPFTDSDWKWINGDLVLLDWYENRGRKLNWDSVVVIQWDQLLFDNIYNQFPGIKRGEIFLSGLQELDGYTEKKWDWTKPGTKERKNYLKFLDYVKKKYDFASEPLCCLFVLEVFPRIFFEKYLEIDNNSLGMLEYKVPIYSKIFRIPFYIKDLGVHWWGDVGKKPLNAEPTEIKKEYIENELKNPEGWRIFHPYFKKW